MKERRHTNNKTTAEKGDVYQLDLKGRVTIVTYFKNISTNLENLKEMMNFLILMTYQS